MNPPFGLETKIWTRLGCVAISILALALIFRRIDLAVFLETVANVRLEWLVVAVLLFGCAALLAAARWHIVLRLSNSSVHPIATARAVLIGHLFNTFLFGPAGGDIAKSALYSRWYDYPASSIFGTCVLDRLLGGAGFVLFGVFAAGALLMGPNVPSVRELWLPWKFWVGLGAALLVVAAAVRVHRRFKGLSPVRRMVDMFVASSRQLLASPKDAWMGLLTAFLSHVCMNVMFLFCLQAVTRESFSFAELLWTFPVISLISSAPMAFAGTGLREGAALVLLGLYGIPSADAVASSLLVLLIYLVWAGFAGVLFWIGEREFRTAPARVPPKSISAVIPTLNEVTALAETIRYVRQVREIAEIIVVDGGSLDGTSAMAKKLGCVVLTSAPGRGGQMRAGTAVAQCDVVLLLHADTWLPSSAGRAILNCLRDRTVVGGGFWKTFRDPSWLMAGSRFRCLVRLLVAGRVAGDQCMFIRRDVLSAVGGVPDMPLMEEFELCRRLRAVGRLALAGATVSTSARRFSKYGVVRTYWRMWRITLQYYLGVPAKELRRSYEKD